VPTNSTANSDGGFCAAAGSEATSPVGQLSTSDVTHPRTRLWCPQNTVYTNGTISYGCIVFAGSEPCNIIEVLSNANWKNAMDNEFSAVMRNRQWHLVPPQHGTNNNDCKWVYKIKRKAYGSLE
jgi:hypothetical protein